MILKNLMASLLNTPGVLIGSIWRGQEGRRESDKRLESDGVRERWGDLARERWGEGERERKKGEGAMG